MNAGNDAGKQPLSVLESMFLRLRMNAGWFDCNMDGKEIDPQKQLAIVIVLAPGNDSTNNINRRFAAHFFPGACQ